MKKTVKIKLNKEEYETITDIIDQVKYNLLKRWIICKDEEEREKIRELHDKANEALCTIERQTLKTRLDWQYRTTKDT